MQPSSSLTGVNHDFTTWAVIFFFFVVCGETRKPQNLEECLRGVQGVRVPVESSVNDCSESCCLGGLHKHRCAGTLDAWAAGGSTCAFLFVSLSSSVPLHKSHSCGFIAINWSMVGSVLLFSNPYSMLVLNRLAESMQQNQARGLMRVLGLMGAWQCVCACVKM